jgi:membrane-associated protease RseP (regulator of RpoE activity)
MGFFIYDLTFLIVFSLLIAFFLYKNRKNVERQGIMYLYRTRVGMKAIDYVGDKFSGTLHFLKYIIVTSGFALMAGILYLIVQSLYVYIKFPQITDTIKAPPIAPLIPYFPKIFGVESFFPPFYFAYFLIALIIVAFSHEFFHGIFMRLFKIKIKATGVGFLGPILAFFVEQEEKSFDSKKNFEQMVVLAAGTFANILMAILFFSLLVGFFLTSFTAGGFVFNTYTTSAIPINQIDQIGEGFNNGFENFTKIYANEKIYLASSSMISILNSTNESLALVYEDAPAIRNGLRGAIFEINTEGVLNQESLTNVLNNKNPGEIVSIKANYEGEILNFEFKLDEHPQNGSKAYLGIRSYRPENKGMVSKFISYLMKFKDPSTKYVPKWDGDFVIFIYDLLWWTAIINLLVALFNMLPLSILDGGRFFYLTILSLTKSDRAAKNAFKLMTYFILLIFALMMLFWFIGIM